jgi:hypothetical protein
VDWNEDGLKDLIVGEYNGEIRYFRNIGSPGNPQLTFDSYIQMSGYPFDIGDYSVPWIDDWNEDGRKDLLVGESLGRVGLLINEGTNADPVFNALQYVLEANGDTLDVGQRSSPVVVDLDDDGLKDLISGEILGQLFYYENNGTNENPQLAPAETLPVGDNDLTVSVTSRAVPIDWEEDGDWDLMVGSLDYRLQLFKQTPSTAPGASIQLQWYNWIIPASGGDLNMNITVNNPGSSTTVTDVWTETQLPDESFYGPLATRTGLVLDPTSIISRDFSQYVPAVAPYGGYGYFAYTGILEELQIYDMSSFTFLKAAGDGGNGSTGAWSLFGWDIEEPSTIGHSFPGEIAINAFPNPFNPTTDISFSLPDAAMVNLNVFDLHGRLVKSLVDGWRSSGNHVVTFDAAYLTSGVYLYTLITASTERSGKLLLIK